MNRNQYPGDCARCGQRVGTGEGRAVREGGTWVVEHDNCQPKQASDAKAPELPRWAIPVRGLTPEGNEAAGLALVDGPRPEGRAYPVNDAALLIERRLERPPVPKPEASE